jgi:hypothetical protein
MADGDPTARYEGWLLSKLLQTPPAELDDFRRAHLQGRDVALEDLRALRACLGEMSRTLRTNVPHGWERVHRAARALGAVAVDGLATAAGGAPPRVRHQPLPFKQGPATPPPPATSTLEPNPAFGGTFPIQAGGRAASSTPLPFVAPAGPDAVVTVGTLSLTLEHHAELSAAGARSPEEWARRREAFGIADDASFVELDRKWQERFAREPDLQRRWVAAYRRALEQKS